MSLNVWRLQSFRPTYWNSIASCWRDAISGREKDVLNSTKRCTKRHPLRKMTIVAAKGDKDLLFNIAEELKDDEEEKEERKGFGAPPPKSKSKKKPSEKPFKVQNSLDQPSTPADEWEANIVRVLAFLFILFFCEGIFLAIAGFLPEAADNFAVNYVYPAFSPTLGVFLLISVIYGLLKTRQGGS